MQRYVIYLSLIPLLVCSAANAADINNSDMNQEGFGDVADLYNSMTPQQRAAVMKQAAIQEQELKKLSPEQQDNLRTQLHDVKDTIYVDKIDPAKLDTSKIKSSQSTLKDMNTYQQKYSQGKINNSAVKPLDADQ